MNIYAKIRVKISAGSDERVCPPRAPPLCCSNQSQPPCGLLHLIILADITHQPSPLMSVHWHFIAVLFQFWIDCQILPSWSTAKTLMELKESSDWDVEWEQLKVSGHSQRFLIMIRFGWFHGFQCSTLPWIRSCWGSISWYRPTGQQNRPTTLTPKTLWVGGGGRHSCPDKMTKIEKLFSRQMTWIFLNWYGKKTSSWFMSIHPLFFLSAWPQTL